MANFDAPDRLRIVAWLLLLAAALLQGSGEAAIITVDGTCTLADAIRAANTDATAGECPPGSGADEIVLTGNVLLTETADGFNALPPIVSDLTIIGNGFTIERDPSAPKVRLLQVDSGIVELNDTVLVGGEAFYGEPEGGGLRALGGQIALIDTTITQSSADLGGGLFVSDQAQVTLLNSTISFNFAEGGGGVRNEGALELVLSSVSYNDVYVGAYAGTSCCAGILNTGDLSLVSSTVSGNTARGGYTGDVGGIASSFGTLSIVDSTISNNTAEQYVGGLTAYSATIVNSTISNNASYYSWLSPSAGALEVTGYALIENTTFAGNRGAEDSPAIYVTPGASLHLRNSILGGNDLPNCDGSILDGGGNLADDSSCGAFAPLTGLDPLLRDNGGPTQTHALAFDSSARAAAGDCGLATDQRGFPRDDGACDGGAFEFGAETFPISVDGECPGSVTVASSGSTPEARVELFQGTGPGTTVIPDGPCADRGLDVANGQRIAIYRADAGGLGSVTLDFVAADCGQLLQAADTASCVRSVVAGIDSCDPLALSHGGAGADPVASPPSSAGCAAGEYLPGEPITLTAAADPGWAIAGWTGTDDDASTDTMNTVTMPATAHAAVVEYQQVCFALGLSHTGSGSDPVGSPPSSDGCPTSTYLAGEVVDLSGAQPDPGWSIGGWTGTDDDASTEPTNTVTMRAAHRIVRVDYVQACHALTLDHTGSGQDPAAWPLGDGTTMIETQIATDFDSADWAHAGDLDGDGDLDVAGASVLDGTAWFENTAGDGTAWTRHVFSTSFQSGSIFTADFDGDSHLDILGTSVFSDEVAWWQNISGDGSIWAEHLIDDFFRQARYATAVDMDADGDLDVLGAANLASDINWWENQAGDGSIWVEHSVSEFFDGAYSAFAADVDGDGDLDVLGAALDADSVSWWENLSGDGTSWLPRMVASIDGAVSVYAADIDADHDIDVVAAAVLDDQILWWENTRGDGSSWNEHVIAGAFDGARTVFVADLDADGDPDILGSALGADAVAWWENVAGDGSLWSEQVVGVSFGGATAASAVDMDDDRDLDVLAVASSTDEIAWWENRYTGDCLHGSFRAGDRLALTATPDPGWEVTGWTGTEDDASTSTTNTALMPDGDLSVSVHYVETGGAFTVSASGTCPGPITIDITTPGPNQDVLLFVGAGGGSTVLPGGPCAGSELDLAAARRWLRATTDGDGQTTVVKDAPAALCGRSLQALDLECATSSVAQLP